MVQEVFTLSTHSTTYNNSVNELQLLVQLSTSLIVLDKKLRITYANPAAEAMLERSCNRLKGLTFDQVFFKISLSNNRLKQLLITEQEFTDNDVIIEFMENRSIHTEISASSILLDDELHLLLECKQIDQQKQISHEAFQHQQWEAARDLIRGLAHEIKNPLGGLRGAAQLLSKELAAPQQEYTQLIIDQADRLTNLVDKLLGPNQLPVFSAHNIHKTLEKVCQLTQFNQQQSIEFIRDYDPSIPDVLVDADKILQVILNIVNNATQAIKDSGTIKLKTRITSNQTINGKRIKLLAKISIIDNGPGIPPQIQDTLFYPMVTARANGTGLGLSIAQTLVNQHHGKISCHSRPGRTEFCILLPLDKES